MAHGSSEAKVKDGSAGQSSRGKSDANKSGQMRAASESKRSAYASSLRGTEAKSKNKKDQLEREDRNKKQVPKEAMTVTETCSGEAG